jgi:hypothetical protein
MSIDSAPDNASESDDPPKGGAMTAATDLDATDEDRAALAPIAAANRVLASDDRGVPEGFVSGLFTHAMAEDLMRYDPRQLAELAAEAAWSLLATRQPGRGYRIGVICCGALTPLPAPPGNP